MNLELGIIIIFIIIITIEKKKACPGGGVPIHLAGDGTQLLELEEVMEKSA